MNLQDTSRASSFTSNLLLAVLIGCATVMTACPPDTADPSDTIRPEHIPHVSNDLG
ncbi:hypothetical protein [Caballeronia sp. dw_276]|jgi:hypothetical protein|uniref:hypothetical protein n=1 Tax=Caballeronia sp. dw_276 TaxID=2719795 RepID=UPI001BD6638D|nr:hypothetical protein [Caballeronia sp. dw_276]